MIYKWLYEKFLMNNKNSISVENTMFSTLLKFSSEVVFNLISILSYLIYYFELNFNSLICVGIIIFILTPLSIFLIVDKSKIIEMYHKRINSNLRVKIFSITFTVLTYLLFIYRIQVLREYLW